VGVDIRLHSFLTSALDGGKRFFSDTMYVNGDSKEFATHIFKAGQSNYPPYVTVDST
jgi:hypothetical protein